VYNRRTLPLSGRQGAFGGRAGSCPYPDHSRGLLGAKVGQNGAIALMRLNLAFLLPEEVLPGAWRQVLGQLGEMGGTAKLRARRARW
jgi:hypothetical protein